MVRGVGDMDEQSLFCFVYGNGGGFLSLMEEINIHHGLDRSVYINDFGSHV